MISDLMCYKNAVWNPENEIAVKTFMFLLFQQTAKVQNPNTVIFFPKVLSELQGGLYTHYFNPDTSALEILPFLVMFIK